MKGSMQRFRDKGADTHLRVPSSGKLTETGNSETKNWVTSAHSKRAPPSALGRWSPMERPMTGGRGASEDWHYNLGMTLGLTYWRILRKGGDWSPHR